MFEAVYLAVRIAELFIAGYCFGRFCRPFMKHSRVVGAAYSLTMLVLYIIPPIVTVFFAFLIGAIIAFLVMCCIDRGNYVQKVFLTVTFFALREFSADMAEILYDRLYYYMEKLLPVYPDMSLAIYAGVCAFYLLLEFLFIYVSIQCILKKYFCRFGMSVKELLVLVIPSVMGVAGHEIIGWYRSFYISEIKNTSGIYDMLSLFYHLAAIVTMIVVIVLYQSIKEVQEEKLQSELLAAQIDSTERHIRQVESLYQDIRSMKHDMTNHILTLERLYAGGRPEEANAYSKSLKTALLEVSGEIKSGNPVTDAILQEWKKEAESKNICFHTDFYYPGNVGIHAFDISVILNNALQNAVENAGNGEVSIVSYHRNNAYMIEISNSFDGRIKWDEGCGLPRTSKDGDGHGYGLVNIRRVARKYSGDISIDVTQGRFLLCVMLMMEKQ